MDPLSISASIIGITTAAAQVSCMLKTFIDGASGATTSARGVLMEVTGISACLHQLQDFLLGKREAARSRRSLVLIEHLVIVFTDCVSIFSELEQTLESLKTDEHMRIIDRLKWSRKETSIAKLLIRLQSSKASLNFMLTILTCTSMDWAEASTRNLSSLVHGLLRSNVDISQRLRALERMHPAQSTPIASHRNTPTKEFEESRPSNRPATCFEFRLNQELQASPVYRRAGLDQLSLSQISVNSNGPSSRSKLSLCDILNASDISLPISAMELWNHHRYIFSGKDSEVDLSSFDAWYNPPAKRSAFIRTAYFNGQYTNQYAQSKFTGHLIYRRFTVTPNSTPVFKEGAVMPHSPKELERVTEEADEDINRAELEDTAVKEKTAPESLGNSSSSPRDAPVAAKPLPPLPPTSPIDFATPQSSKVAKNPMPPPIDTLPSFPAPPKSTPVPPPPSTTPPPRPQSRNEDSTAMVPYTRRKVNKSTYSILCEEEESIFPTRKWTKPLSDMGDALHWTIEVLQNFNAIEY